MTCKGVALTGLPSLSVSLSSDVYSFSLPVLVQGRWLRVSCETSSPLQTCKGQQQGQFPEVMRGRAGGRNIIKLWLNKSAQVLL